MKAKKCPECGKDYIEKRTYPKENSVLYIHEQKKGFLGIITITKSCYKVND